MKNQIAKILALVLFTFGAISCEKEYGDDTLGPLEDSLAPIPVTVTNQEFFERFPVVTASVSGGGAFSVTFQIPPGSGTIREITRVTTGASGLTNLQSASSALAYNPAAVVGNGSNEITFSSTLAAYTAYRTRVTAAIAGPAATVSTTPTTPTQIRFFFLLTLEDGTQLIPTEVRVRVVE